MYYLSFEFIHSKQIIPTKTECVVLQRGTRKAATPPTLKPHKTFSFSSKLRTAVGDLQPRRRFKQANKRCVTRGLSTAFAAQQSVTTVFLASSKATAAGEKGPQLYCATPSELVSPSECGGGGMEKTCKRRHCEDSTQSLQPAVNYFDSARC
jgi:hypothetical protein